VITGPGTVNDKGCVHIHATPIAQWELKNSSQKPALQPAV
jgi:hypothetical protein